MAYEWQLEKKEETRLGILEAASKLLLREGIRRASVARFMGAAGLTVGGFYAHFRDKDSLVLASLRHAFERATARFVALPGASARERLAAFRRQYLNPGHRDHPEQGCPLVALSSDSATMPPAFRREVAAIFNEHLERRLSSLGWAGSPERRAELLAEFSQLLGAQLLARAVRGTPLSDEILATTLAQMENK